MIRKTQVQVLFLAPVLALLISGCGRKMAPATSSENPAGGMYKQNANNMVYTVSPYGSLALPGQWTAGKYAKASRNQYFYRSDTTTMIVSIDACRNQPFARDGIDGFEFVRRYYEAESKYQVQLLEQTPRVLIEDKENKYMLWTVHSDGIDQYFLAGVKDCTCNECAYRTLTLKNRRLTEKQATRLLQDIFLGERQ